MKKTRMVGLPDGKTFEDTFSGVDWIPACDGQTDRQTDRQTDGQTSCDGIVRVMHTRHAVTMSNFFIHNGDWWWQAMPLTSVAVLSTLGRYIVSVCTSIMQWTARFVCGHVMQCSADSNFDAGLEEMLRQIFPPIPTSGFSPNFTGYDFDNINWYKAYDSMSQSRDDALVNVSDCG